MSEIRYRNRRAMALENEHLEVIVTFEGGHIAVIRDKATGVNPLWSPVWPTIEPSQYDPAQHPEYGLNSESKLLAGILGHDLLPRSVRRALGRRSSGRHDRPRRRLHRPL